MAILKCRSRCPRIATQSRVAVGCGSSVGMAWRCGLVIGARVVQVWVPFWRRKDYRPVLLHVDMRELKVEGEVLEKEAKELKRHI